MQKYYVILNIIYTPRIDFYHLFLNIYNFKYFTIRTTVVPFRKPQHTYIIPIKILTVFEYSQENEFFIYF